MAFGKLLAGLECRRLGYDGVSPLVDRLSLGAYNRRFRPNRTSADWLSRDEEQVDAYLPTRCAATSPACPCSGT